MYEYEKGAQSGVLEMLNMHLKIYIKKELVHENEKGEQSWVEEMLTHLKKNM